MFRRPSLRVGRKETWKEEENLEGRRKFKIFKKFARIAFVIEIPMEIF
jgi:hypothetical protein